jgi:transcriptional regulator with XRE-family HTH domain
MDVSKEVSMLYLTVKLYAREKRLNRNQLQLMSGVTLPLLTRYWNNTTTEVRLDALEKIAKALGLKNPGKLVMTEAEIMTEFKAEGWQYLNRREAEKEVA